MLEVIKELEEKYPFRNFTVELSSGYIMLTCVEGAMGKTYYHASEALDNRPLADQVRSLIPKVEAQMPIEDDSRQIGAEEAAKILGECCDIAERHRNEMKDWMDGWRN
jgi:hypothetical protein